VDLIGERVVGGMLGEEFVEPLDVSACRFPPARHRPWRGEDDAEVTLTGEEPLSHERDKVADVLSQ
jgi:hypothetical protein